MSSMGEILFEIDEWKANLSRSSGSSSGNDVPGDDGSGENDIFKKPVETSFWLFRVYKSPGLQGSL